MQVGTGIVVAFFLALASLRSLGLFPLLLGRWVIESGCESWFQLRFLCGSGQDTFLPLKLHSHVIGLPLSICALLCAFWTMAVDAEMGLRPRRSQPHHP